ncbi:hypothetical protein IPL68_01210 [Candidatus Saccharibacteria bacterium]|nr:MAG: hypothetical protein IPL68_01210 [Candidatus Saccharibacteria bacterium]
MNIFLSKEVAPALTSLEWPLVVDVLGFTAKAVNRLNGMEARKPAQLAIANTPNRLTATEVIDTQLSKPSQTVNLVPLMDINDIRIRVAALAGGSPDTDAKTAATVLENPDTVRMI